METESKYLKKIRDMIHKKNSGSSSGTIYSGPNTKAKYLNDIAKEIDNLDIGGGGSSDSPLLVINCVQRGNNWYADISDQDFWDAFNDDKAMVLNKGGYLYDFDIKWMESAVAYFRFVRTKFLSSTKPGDDTKPALKIEKQFLTINTMAGISTTALASSEESTYFIVEEVVASQSL